jgi:hypothetical protein
MSAPDGPAAARSVAVEISAALRAAADDGGQGCALAGAAQRTADWSTGATARLFNGSVPAGSARKIAAALAAVAMLSCVSLFLFFSVGGPFGTLNDAGNGALAVLCATLALVLHRPGRVVTTALAVMGAAVAGVGSYLVMTDTTGYFLAGLESAFGFALIGLWLLVVALSGDVPARALGQAAGVVMALGLVNLPGILRGLDDQDSAPTWLLAAGVCWAGTYLLLPLWAFRFACAGRAG